MTKDELLDVVRAGFALHVDGIHGLAHWRRVRDNGLRLAELTGANAEIVELFAILHDSKRLSDGRDRDHGRRAAEFAQSLRPELGSLGDADFEDLVFACQYHADGLTEADITVQTCWDADRLDLGRIGIRPDARRLCTRAAKNPALIEWAVRASQGGRS